MIKMLKFMQLKTLKQFHENQTDRKLSQVSSGFNHADICGWVVREVILHWESWWFNSITIQLAHVIHCTLPFLWCVSHQCVNVFWKHWIISIKLFISVEEWRMNVCDLIKCKKCFWVKANIFNPVSSIG